MEYNLIINGDPFEIHYWPLFIEREFPSYEKFWQKLVVPVTHRPGDGHLKSNSELSLMGKNEGDICLAQLNYSILKHLIRVFEIRRTQFVNKSMGLDLLTEGFVRLVGAQDTAFEILERIKNPSNYTPWGEKEGKRARGEWQKNNTYPLQSLRDYRNHLIHGRMMPSEMLPSLYFPEIGKENEYLDWRITTNQYSYPSLPNRDFALAKDILDQAWKETIIYIEDHWKNI